VRAKRLTAAFAGDMPGCLCGFGSSSTRLCCDCTRFRHRVRMAEAGRYLQQRTGLWLIDPPFVDQR
jgi:hypothetical protein